LSTPWPTASLSAIATAQPQLADRKDAVVGFVRRQLDNPRPATRRKAEKFLKKWVDTEKNGGRSEDVRPPLGVSGNPETPRLTHLY